MRKYILLTISLLFFAFVFQSDRSTGWFVQPTPVNDLITDISFVDSLKGWAVTDGNPQSNDTAFIMRTTNGGVNWVVQFDTTDRFNAVQFLDSNYGYAVGGFGRGIFMKTTNGGVNWNYSTPFGSGVAILLDLKFVNRDTGWICSNLDIGGGVYKTTNRGVNWIKQLNETYRPSKLFFLNQDTGWVCANNTSLYRTNNGGSNWVLQASFSYINGLQFTDKDTGYAVAGDTRFMKTINGGSNWMSLNNPSAGPYALCLYFINATTGWYGGALNNIYKITDGQTVKVQQSATFRINSIQFIDSNVGFAGGTSMIKTTDGGGLTAINQNTSTVPDIYTLYQNYPNPFNPNTVISYQLSVAGFITLKVFNLQGKEIQTLVNKKQTAGSYSAEFNGNNLPSGIYFYTLEVNNTGREAYIDTKKMVLVK